MELLSPAGNLEKLKYVYNYGADAAYIGLKNFSLRYQADNFKEEEYETIKKIKGNKKLYGALNIFFNNKDLKALEENIDYIKNYPLDAFIISDIGALPILQKHFPNVDVHLSTQANCINKEAARLYYNMGFKRVILGRETSLEDIKEIKQTNRELELETFIHGAMCLAYSGRCFLSKYMANRSANKGDCSHSCRWNYRVLEEESRSGEYFPVIEDDKGTTILSSKDLCLINDMEKLVNAGIDSFKIEGRMKSIYYASVITRAYRKVLDSLSNIKVENLQDYIDEIEKVSHREWTKGFFFDNESVQATSDISYIRDYTLVGKIIEKKNNLYLLELNNRIFSTDEIEYISPNFPFKIDKNFKLYDEKNHQIEKGNHGQIVYLETNIELLPGDIIRKKSQLA